MSPRAARCSMALTLWLNVASRHKWTSVCECACVRSIVRISSAPVPTSWLVVTQLHHCTHMDTIHGLITQSRTLLWLISYGTAESQAKRIHANQIWLALGCNPSQKWTAQSIDLTLHKLQMALSLILGHKIRPSWPTPLCKKLYSKISSLRRASAAPTLLSSNPIGAQARISATIQFPAKHEY